MFMMIVVVNCKALRSSVILLEKEMQTDVVGVVAVLVPPAYYLDQSSVPHQKLDPYQTFLNAPIVV